MSNISDRSQISHIEVDTVIREKKICRPVTERGLSSFYKIEQYLWNNLNDDKDVENRFQSHCNFGGRLRSSFPE